jgi:hypothetical protein
MICGMLKGCRCTWAGNSEEDGCCWGVGGLGLPSLLESLRRASYLGRWTWSYDGCGVVSMYCGWLERLHEEDGLGQHEGSGMPKTAIWSWLD